MAPQVLPRRRVIDITTPAAGADFTVRNDSGLLWRVRTLAGVFTADANAATRSFELTLNDGNGVLWVSGSQNTLTAGLARNFAAFPGAFTTSPGGRPIVCALPSGGLVIYPGGRLASSVNSIQVGDAWTALRMEVDEYPLHARTGNFPVEQAVLTHEWGA